jgi:hypothetical protein
MHPITALMLSRQMEDERRRIVATRYHRFAERELTGERPRRPSWIDRIRQPRLGLSGS